MIRRMMVFVVVVMGMAVGVWGQGVPGGGGGGFGGGAGGGFGGAGGAGGFNIDPDLLDSIQQMTTIGQQVMTNMQNAGEDPQQFFQDMAQQVQDGTFDQDAVQQSMVTKGYMTQEMVQQINTAQAKMQVGVQKMLVTATYDQIRQLLNPTDEEWAVLLPKVQRVLAAQAEVAQGGDTMNQGNTVLGIGGGGFGGGRGAGFMSRLGGPQGSDTELGKAWKALQEAAQDKKLADTTLGATLRTWRDLHEKARAELKLAQTDLLNILTLRQESVMMMAGVL
jgi:hypothetical protein